MDNVHKAFISLIRGHRVAAGRAGWETTTSPQFSPETADAIRQLFSCLTSLYYYPSANVLHFLERIDPIQSILRIEFRDQSVFSFKRPEFVTGEKRNLAVVQLVDVFPPELAGL